MAHPDPAAWGVLSRYRSATGEWRQVPDHVVGTILEAMGAGTERPPKTSAVRFVREGSTLRDEVRLEDGSRLRPGRPLPAGYHRFGDTLLVSSPSVCPLPQSRRWGFAVQLPSVRSSRSWGFGDFFDLRRLGRWSRGLGAELLLLNPLHAPAPGLPQEPSPYYPSSRRFRNPLYLRVEEAPGAAQAGRRLDSLAAAGRSLSRLRRIDRDAVYALKIEALELLWAGFEGDRRFERYRGEQGAALEDFATWCVLVETHGRRWRRWARELQHPHSAAVARFRSEKRNRVRFHEWLQWLLDLQLRRAGASIPLIADLAVGFDPDGADAWLYQDSLAADFRIGAPPDRFVPQGQDWGLPPLDPWKLRQQAYAPFIETVRSCFAHAGGLRIDHVLGLFRLWWVPRGGEPADGAYVRYPTQELLDIVALESARACAYVIGEDLGTVQPSMRRELRRRNVLGCRVFWFEERSPARYPAASLASVTTHDLPTVAGVWTGADSRHLVQLGGAAFDAEEARQRQRLARTARISLGGDVGAAVRGVYAALASSPSLCLTVSLEDALGVEERPNHPGTTPDRWPNWSLALPKRLEQIELDAEVRDLALAVRRGRAD
jgi:4-alpha-glucanotransferase